MIPVSEFKKNLAAHLKDIQSKGQTIVLTHNGRNAAVVLSPKDYETFDYMRKLVTAAAKGEKEINAGKGIPHFKAFKKRSRSRGHTTKEIPS